MDENQLPQQILESLGYTVIPRPTSEKKEADFLVQYRSTVALVEAKLKSDDTQKIKEKEKKFSQGNCFISDAKLGRNETISGIIKYASSQLKSSFNESHNFSIILFVTIGIGTKAKKDQIIDTIYGATEIVSVSYSPHALQSFKKCYFFGSSDFYRRKDYLDAAIVCSYTNKVQEIKFCLNPYSKRYSSLNNSEFMLPFRNINAVIDPIALEIAGDAYIPDADVDRNNPRAVLENLEIKYAVDHCVAYSFNSPEISISYE